ncbi:MAG: hypothetical protein OEZ22_04905 [Spirochaetia bacterium]|nr:hypothetical protein [Spirochaetia bacterium]
MNIRLDKLKRFIKKYKSNDLTPEERLWLDGAIEHIDNLNPLPKKYGKHLLLILTEIDNIDTETANETVAVNTCNKPGIII